MELLSLSSHVRTPLSSSSPKVSIGNRRFLSRRGLTFPGSEKYSDGSKLKFLYFRAQASSEKPDVIKQEAQNKDEDIAFVAGATGKVGSRAVRELLKLGFRVRACVRSPQKAESLVQSVQEMKMNTGDASRETQSVEKLEIVECDLENQDMIIPAIGNASVVLCCIGASEKEVFDITGPYRIDYQATKNLIDAATVAQVDHFILLTSLGTNKVGFPAAILNLFWGVLIWKRKAEEALIASGLPYTVVRPGGMERPTDAYKETHNIFLAMEDTLFGGQVSNLQVAELMAFMAKNRSMSYCKVVEVIAETTAPLTPMGELLARIPSQRVDSSTSKGIQDANLPGPSPEAEAKSTAIVEEPAQVKARLTKPLSPYIMYDDLKPPTSPSPSVPTLSLVSTSSSDGAPPLSTTSGNGSAQPPPLDKPSDKHHSMEPKPRPLSPFSMYEDLKPPTSPIPSPKKC